MQVEGTVGMPERFITVTVRVSVNIGDFINSAQTLQNCIMVGFGYGLGVRVRFRASFSIISALGYFIYPYSLDGAKIYKAA